MEFCQSIRGINRSNRVHAPFIESLDCFGRPNKQVTLGVKGYKLMTVLPNSFGTYTSARTISFARTSPSRFVDGGGNDMGSADRFSDSCTLGLRTILTSSDTLELTGDVTKQTADGTVPVDALSCFEPKVRAASCHIPTFEFC